jgi:hypothetical protein
MNRNLMGMHNKSEMVTVQGLPCAHSIAVTATVPLVKHFQIYCTSNVEQIQNLLYTNIVFSAMCTLHCNRQVLLEYVTEPEYHKLLSSEISFKKWEESTG